MMTAIIDIIESYIALEDQRQTDLIQEKIVQKMDKVSEGQ